ncbi:MAG TPA: hypothetical protein VM221_11685 [Armatimonadota bacterium]|nr:hypothetical protein [Armatimonadota bacterium]
MDDDADEPAEAIVAGGEKVRPARCEMVAHRRRWESEVLTEHHVALPTMHRLGAIGDPADPDKAKRPRGISRGRAFY